MTVAAKPPASARLTIKFLNYWSAGTGASGGGDVDRACLREKETGLPYLAAKQLKGHLRESAKRLHHAGDQFWVAHLKTLFGKDPEEFGLGSSALRFEDARLPGADAAAIGASPHSTRLAQRLFGRMASVKIKHKTGAAETRAFRRLEAVVPLKLECAVHNLGAAPAEWVGELDKVCAITLALGGLKSDGYGRAILCLRPLT